jgi:hypothetical protein
MSETATTPPHDATIGAAPLRPIATVAPRAIGSNDVDTLRRELEEVRDAMRLAIAEAREKSEIVGLFLRGNQISTDAAVLEARAKKKKNSVSHLAFREIGLRVDSLRGQWLKDLKTAGRRFMGQPGDGVRIGTPAPPHLIVLDDLGLGGEPGRTESQNLQLLADRLLEEFEALVADPKAKRPHWGGRKIRVVPLSAIRGDEQAQPRAALTTDLVAKYAEAMERGDKFEPVIVFEDAAGVLWLADGFHRIAAATKLKLKTIECNVHKGGLRDAILYSCGANFKHGLQRTNDDRRRAVMRLLNDAEWGKWTDSEIAKQCKVGHQLVGKLRADLAPLTCPATSEPRIYRTKHGTTATMRTSNIGRSRRSALKPAESAETDLPLPAPVPETDAAPQAPRVKPSSRLDPIIIRLEAIRRELDGLPLAELLSDGRRQRFGEVRDQVGSGLREIIHLAVAERDERTALVPEAEERETIAEVTESVEPIST